VAVLEDGQVRQVGRLRTTPAALRTFAQRLQPTDEVVLEATCNTYAVVQLLRQFAGRVIVSNPHRTRAIAEAKIKTDTVDAEVLVRLAAGGWLPEVWVPDAQTQALRQQAAHRVRVVHQRTRLKNRIHAILHRNLVLGCPRSDLFGKAGRQWLVGHALPLLPTHEQAIAQMTLRELDLLDEELKAVDRALATCVVERKEIHRLMTIPGIDLPVAITLIATIGDIRRFRSPTKLVGYVGLDPRVRQSGGRPAVYGPISKQGQASARHMLVQAAWAAVKAPGPLRAFYHRIRARRGTQIAIVATARKLTVLVWYLLARGEDYAFARQFLIGRKLRELERLVGLPARRVRRDLAGARDIREFRQRELQLCLQAERTYQKLTGRWKVRSAKQDAGATTGVRL